MPQHGPVLRQACQPDGPKFQSSQQHPKHEQQVASRFAADGKVAEGRRQTYLIHLVQPKELFALHVIRPPRPLHLVRQLTPLLQVVQRTSQPCMSAESIIESGQLEYM